MTVDNKVLGQVTPAINTLTDLYPVPTGRQAIVSTFVVCNTSANGPKVRIAIRVGGAAITTKQYIVYDVALDANQPLFLTIGATLNAGDVISVQSDTVGTAFTAFGSEIY